MGSQTKRDKQWLAQLQSFPYGVHGIGDTMSLDELALFYLLASIINCCHSQRPWPCNVVISGWATLNCTETVAMEGCILTLEVVLVGREVTVLGDPFIPLHFHVMLHVSCNNEAIRSCTEEWLVQIWHMKTTLTEGHSARGEMSIELMQ